MLRSLTSARRSATQILRLYTTSEPITLNQTLDTSEPTEESKSSPTTEHRSINRASGQFQPITSSVWSKKPLDGDEVLDHHDFFEVRHLVNKRDLFNARVHLGHKDVLRNPHMKPYLFGSRLSNDIIDLEQTHSLLGDALNFTAHIAYRRGIILFINRNRMMMPVVERTAEEAGEYSHCRYWVGSILTDADKSFGIVTRRPDLIIFLNTLTNTNVQHAAVVTASKMLIPTVGVVDSNCDPRLVTYPVPGNDDTPCAIRLYCGLFREAILRGKAAAGISPEFES